MKKPILFSGLCFLVASLVVVACGDDSTVNPADAGLHDAANDAETGSDSANGATLTGNVVESRLDDAGAEVPVTNASVCVLTSPEIPCVTTGSDGAYILQAPAPPSDGGSLDFAISATAPGYLGAVTLGSYGGGYGYTSSLILTTDANAMTFATQAGFTYPPGGTAFIELRLPSGASATLAGVTGKGPVYGDATGTPSPALTAATASGVVWFGNVTPGPFTITVTLPGKTCFQSAHGSLVGDWVGPTANSLSGTTAANTMLIGITMFCQ